MLEECKIEDKDSYSCTDDYRIHVRDIVSKINFYVRDIWGSKLKAHRDVLYASIPAGNGTAN
ncbi:hypothetical protein X777_08763 [Ooceraea biroi]|uniref:Uncharacterized protein n=1 Tax=Ooceraea biroi TaxID=2015173 RepID=A0A026W8L5_OOCBI|nr:hypothetical protein X777_08763 [Ooceraea biroi]